MVRGSCPLCTYLCLTDSSRSYLPGRTAQYGLPRLPESLLFARSSRISIHTRLHALTLQQRAEVRFQRRPTSERSAAAHTTRLRERRGDRYFFPRLFCEELYSVSTERSGMHQEPPWNIGGPSVGRQQFWVYISELVWATSVNLASSAL